MFAYYHAAFPATENVPMIFSMYITYTTSNRYALSQLKWYAVIQSPGINYSKLSNTVLVVVKSS